MENEKINQALRRNIGFDAFGRYANIVRILEENRHIARNYTVLDVGGRGNKLREFLPQDTVSYLDPNVETDDLNYIPGDACKMPLGDNSFDWVVSNDTFEHIPSNKRITFLQEQLRVAKIGVILIAPFNTRGVHDAEKRLNHMYKDTHEQQDHPWLIEHLEYGLPDEEIVESYLQKSDIPFQKFGNNDIFLWELLLGLHFVIRHTRNDLINEKLLDINEYYNTHMFPLDHQGSTYRKIYVMKKDPRIQDVSLLESNTIEAKLDVIQHILDLVTHIDDAFPLFERKSHDQIVELQSKYTISAQLVESLEKKVEEQNKKMHKQNAEILHAHALHAQAQQTITLLKNSWSWKITYPLRLLFAFPVFVFRLCKDIPLAIALLHREGVGTFMKRTLWYLRGKRLISDIPFSTGESINEQYTKFLQIHKRSQKEVDMLHEEMSKFQYRPKISIITPVYNVDPIWLNSCIQSVCSQWYDNWELCLYDDASTSPETMKCLQSWEDKDARIKIQYGKINAHISKASNQAVAMATGEFIGLLDNDDEITEDALFYVVQALNMNPQIDMIYSDEDKIDIQNQFCDPHFKPDWSPDLLLSYMYTCHFSVYRKSMVEEVGGFREGYEGSQDYDLALRITEKTKNIFHIPHVLYHWRKLPTSTASSLTAKKYIQKSTEKTLDSAMKRRNIEGKLEWKNELGRYQIHRAIKNKKKVSIIIPFKDKSHLLKTCVESIFHRTEYPHFEIILVSNNSTEKAVFDYVQQLKEKHNNVFFYEYNIPFNYSKINNWAVQHATGEYILFLNNDIEVIEKDWLTAMVEQVQREEVGAVGAKLLFENGMVQHAGVILGLGGVAGHAHKYFPREHSGYFQRLQVVHNVSACTAACLLVKKEVFLEVHGFNEVELKVAFNDVDLCLKIREKGYLIVFTPYALLYHYESITRGHEDTAEKQQRFATEIDYMKKTWGEILEQDPYYNVNLTMDREDFSLRIK